MVIMRTRFNNNFILTNPNDIFYVYTYTNPIDNNIFYVGKGKNKNLTKYNTEGWKLNEV